MSRFVDTSVTPGATVSGAATSAKTRLQVYALADATALAETIFPALDSTLVPPPEVDMVWLNFTCDDGAGSPVGFYINCDLIGGALVVAAPDPLATVAPPLNITQQCIWVPAGAEWHRKFAVNQAFRAIQVSGADAFLRVEATSEL